MSRRPTCARGRPAAPPPRAQSAPRPTTSCPRAPSVLPALPLFSGATGTAIETATASDGVVGAVTDCHAASGTVKVGDCVFFDGGGGAHGARGECHGPRACGRDCGRGVFHRCRNRCGDGFGWGMWTGRGRKRLCGTENGGEGVFGLGGWGTLRWGAWTELWMKDLLRTVPRAASCGAPVRRSGK